VLERVERDRGDSIPDELTLRKTILHLCDWKMWAFGKSYFMDFWDTKNLIIATGLMYFCATVPAYAIG